MSLYHYAFSLKHMIHWALPPERAPPWFGLESTLCSPLPLVHLITTKLPSEFQMHPVVSFLQYVWKRVAIILGFKSHLHSLASVWLNPSLCIEGSPLIWKVWVDKGIFTLRDLYEGGALKSFVDLRAQYRLPHNQFWRYLQLRHLLCHVFGSPNSAPHNIDWLTQALKTFGAGCKASIFYSMLLKSSINDPPTLKHTWESDLNTQFTDSAWANILKNGKKLSKELRTRLVQFKILNRLYWTPHKMYRAKLTNSPNCWKCLQSEGTLIHMIWSCPLIQAFWSEIQRHIKRIVKHHIPFSEGLFVLGDLSLLHDFPSNEAEWIQTALMVGRKLITSQWKSHSVPPVTQWLNELGKLALIQASG